MPQKRLASGEAEIAVLVVGDGGMGAHWHAALAPGAPDALAAGLRLDAIYPPKEGKAALSPGVASLESLEAAVDRRPGLVIDTTPANARLTITAALLRAGLPVLCEPPMARDARTAARLLGLAARAAAPFAIAQRLRFAVGPRSLAAQIRGPAALEAVLPRYIPSPWTRFDAVLLDIFDTARAVLGADARIAAGRLLVGGVAARFEMARGAVFTCTTGDGAAPALTLKANGDVLHWPGTGPARDAAGRPLAMLDGPDGPLLATVAALRAGRHGPTAARDNARSLAMLVALSKSARQGGAPVPVHDISLAGDADDTGWLRAKGDV